VNKAAKSALIADLHERLSNVSLGVVTEYRGLTVAQMNKLRRELQAVGAKYRVTKNTLTQRAIKETAFAKLNDLLRGPTGLVTTANDPVAVAKILVRFSEQNNKLKISGGVLDGEPVPASSVTALSKLPSREILIAQLLGLLQAPASQLLRTIQEPGASLARLLAAIEKSKTSAGGPSAE
jgi:large subunit ribosomal protein L10